jgi:glutamine synthetase
VERGWKGWLEDRRPNSAADPYKVAARIIKTVKIAEASLTQAAKKVA